MDSLSEDAFISSARSYSYRYGCWKEIRAKARCAESNRRTLEALAVHNGWSTLVILLLGDPHLLEGRQRSQNRTTDPYGVFTLGWSNNLDLHG